MTAAEAVAERDRVLSEVEIAKRRQLEAGMTVLRAWADRGIQFSANDVRAELREVGVTGAATGALFSKAVTEKLLRRVGLVRSTDTGTHGKAVQKYIGAAHASGLASLIPTAPAGETVTVPVQRDRGRFTRTSSTPTPDALFDIEEGTR